MLVIVTNDYTFSSNVIEVIRPILNFSFFFFLQKGFTCTKSTKLLTVNKKKKKKTKKKKKKKKNKKKKKEKKKKA